MRKKPFLIITVMLVLLLLVSACAKPVEAEPTESAPVVSYEGFLLNDVVTGGSLFPNSNARTATFAADGGDTLINIDFIGGSRMSGGTEETNASELPYYSVRMIEHPYRLVVEFDSLTYCDMMRDVDFSKTPLVYGCFKHTFAENEENVAIYIQLREKAMFRAEELSGSLKITLRPVAAEEEAGSDASDVFDVTVSSANAGEGYYVVANEYRSYCMGSIPRDLALEPVLSADGQTKLLISQKFDTREDAEAFLESSVSGIDGAVRSSWSVALLADNAPPDYSESMEYEAAHGIENARQNGENVSLGLLIDDGIYLTMTPEKDGYVYSKRIVSGEGSEQYAFEQLFVMERGGAKKRLIDYEFGTIDTALYSPDGRKLAVLEHAEESTHLYIFDCDTRELLCDLTDMGFGDTVSTFTWDSMGSIVYSIGGSGSTVVHQYDFNVPTESKRHSVVDKKGADEGSVAFCDGEVYFTETKLEIGAMIYRVKPDGGIRREFMKGSSFELSGNSKYMAYTESGGDYGTENAAPAFSYRNMSTGEIKLITNEFAVYDFLWSWDGNRIFYFENKLSGDSNESLDDGTDGADSADAPLDSAAQNDPYPYTLWMYDVRSGMSKALIDLPYTSIAGSNRADEVYLRYYDPETMGEVVRATYIITLD